MSALNSEILGMRTVKGTGVNDDGVWEPEEADSPEEELMLKIAHLYFVAEKTKTEIGTELSISRQKVDALLKNARKQGIVTIALSSSSANRRAISCEDRLLREYRPWLKTAIVVPPPSGGAGKGAFGHSLTTDTILSEAELQLRIAEAGGKYLSRRLAEIVKDIPPGDNNRASVILGGGRLVYASVRNVTSDKSLDDLDILPLSGFFNNRAYSSSPHGCCRELQARVGGQNYWLPCPALARQALIQEGVEVGITSKEYDFITSLPLVSETLRTMTLPDRPCIIVTNVAPLSAEQLKTTLQALYPKNKHVQIVRQFRQIWSQSPPVARIVGMLFDENGLPVNAPWSTIGASFRFTSERIKQRKIESIVIAGGDPTRVAGIRALLRAKLVTTLITDESTANAILLSP